MLKYNTLPAIRAQKSVRYLGNAGLDKQHVFGVNAQGIEEVSTLRYMLNPHVLLVRSDLIPDRVAFEEQAVAAGREKMWPGYEVEILMSCTNLTIHLNDLNSLCKLLTKISGNNARYESLRRLYLWELNGLKQKSYSIEDWT